MGGLKCGPNRRGASVAREPVWLAAIRWPRYLLPMRPGSSLASVALGLALHAAPLWGQSAVALSGVVLDSLTVVPLAQATVLVEDLGISTLTDETGEFRLPGVTVGQHVLTVQKAGFIGRSFRLNLDPAQLGDLEVGYVSLLRRREATASITGTLTDSVTGSPVEFVAIGINGQIVTFTNERGAFRVDNVDRSTVRLDARRIGYQPFAADLQAAGDESVFDVNVKLHPIPMELPEIVVEGDRVIYAFGRMREFYRRRETGLGHYFTRTEIERRNPLYVSDLLRMVPGFRVTPSSGINQVSVRRCGAPTVYLDGMPLRGVQLDEFVFPEHVEAIEAYRGAFIPAEFMTFGACGVVAVWTR